MNHIARQKISQFSDTIRKGITPESLPRIQSMVLELFNDPELFPLSPPVSDIDERIRSLATEFLLDIHALNKDSDFIQVKRVMQSYCNELDDLLSATDNSTDNRTEEN